MAKIVSKTANGVEEWEIGSFSLTIGRRPDNNIVLSSTAAAGRHAVVGYDNGRYYVEDLKTANGTQLNGAPVTRALLKHGDLIGIGGSHLLFLMPELQQKPPKIPVVPPRVRDEVFQPAPAAAAGVGVPAAGAKVSADDSLKLLDHLVGSIRSHRDREKTEKEEAQARLREEWEKTLAYAEQLKRKVGGDPRIKYFEISRRNNDAMIRVQREPSLPQQTITLSMEHPDDKGHLLRGVWLRRNGQLDRCYETADEAIGELVRDLAFLLA